VRTGKHPVSDEKDNEVCSSIADCTMKHRFTKDFIAYRYDYEPSWIGKHKGVSRSAIACSERSPVRLNHCLLVASWFETREDALLTMRFERDLILRSPLLRASRRMRTMKGKLHQAFSLFHHSDVRPTYDRVGGT
jgi:hypothetical protein